MHLTFTSVRLIHRRTSSILIVHALAVSFCYIAYYKRDRELGLNKPRQLGRKFGSWLAVNLSALGNIITQNKVTTYTEDKLARCCCNVLAHRNVLVTVRLIPGACLCTNEPLFLSEIVTDTLSYNVMSSTNAL